MTMAQRIAPLRFHTVVSPGERSDPVRVHRRSNAGGILSTGCRALLLLGMAACGETGTPPPEPEPPRATTMTVSPPSATLVSLGDTATFTAGIRDQNGAALGGGVTWSSSDPAVFAVTPAGLVTAVSNGTGTLTASHQNLGATASIIVAQAPATVAAHTGGDQEGLAGRELPDPVEVSVLDAGGAAVTGVTVTFAAAEGHGSADPASANSDDDGVARTNWTLGGEPGPQRLTASVAAGVLVEIGATALPELPVVPVCDRTSAVRDALVRLSRRAGCEFVSTADLRGIDTLDLSNSGISELRTGDFSGLDSLVFLGLGGNQVAELPGTAFTGLPGLQGLDLRGNRLEGLPRAIFAGLTELVEMRLAGNPGAPFGFDLNLQRQDTTRLGVQGPATITLAIAKGAPFAIALPLSVRNGTASGNELSIGAGQTVGPEITVEGPAGDSVVTRVLPGAAPALPEGFDGIELRTGSPLALFDPASNTATYRVVFNATWSPSTHPANFPPGPHFSPLIGSVHDDGVTFWALGETATRGIEVMAETGGTSPLTIEINAAVPQNALAVINGRGVNESPGSATIQGVTVREDFPLVTLVTMIAPSPDWFVGVAGLSLMGDDGRWLDELQVVLYPLDSGTDSGTSYRSANSDTSPKQPIRGLKGISPFSDAPIGTFTFTRVTAADGSGSR